jgi:hypothetical protein
VLWVEMLRHMIKRASRDAKLSVREPLKVLVKLVSPGVIYRRSSS